MVDMCLAEHTQWFTIDRVGRRKLFISHALGMCGVLVAESICVAINNTSAAIGAVVFVFLFEACFTWGTSLLPILPYVPHFTSSLLAVQPRLDGYCLDVPT